MKKFRDREIIREEIELTEDPGGKTVIVHNISGSINIKGYNGTRIDLKVERTIIARSKEKIKKAREEVGLGIKNTGNYIVFYLESPYTGKDKPGKWKTEKIGYEVHMAYEMKVPYHTLLVLKTLNAGIIDVQNIKGDCTIRNKNGNINMQSIEGCCTLDNVNGNVDVLNLKGDFKVRTINGTILMKDIAGTGSAQSENGEVMVSLQQDPCSESRFRTINGNIKVTFPKTLSADFILETLNGIISCNFPVTYLPGKTKHFFLPGQSREFRVGNGGPKIRIDTLNGNIFIRQ